MARVRINRNSFGAGVLSKRAQANSNSEMYNYGLTLCRNMMIDVLGGAYKRQGSRFVKELGSDKVKLVEFLYAPGKSCIVMFGEGEVYLFEYSSRNRKVREVKITYDKGVELKYEDYKNLQYFQQENVLYFYIPKREKANYSGSFWSIQLIAGTEFEFVITYGYKFTPEPKAPYTPSRLLQVTKEGEKFTLQPINEEGVFDANIFSNADVGRKVSFKFYKDVYSNGQHGEIWPEVKITSVTEGKAEAELTAGSTKVIFDDNSINIREWFISAFGGESEEGGILGEPGAMSMFQGRLYLGKKTYVFASKLYGWPFCFAYGANEDSGFVRKITSGNMGNILWMYPISKMIIGTADGVYLVGNTAQYAEVISNHNFTAVKIGSMGCSSLPPIDAEGDVIFVGTDNRSVYELEITQDGGYVVKQINRLSSELAKTGIIDHAWQQYPRKTYWAVTQDGSLVACSYDNVEGIRAWHDHVFGGKNAYVLQCETTKESNTDLLWLVVRRDIGNESKVFLEYLPTPFDPVEEDEFEQQYTDSGVMLQKKEEIKDIVNGKSFYVNIEYDERFRKLFKYINTNKGHLLVIFEDLKTIYDNPDLNYHLLNDKGFYIAAYEGQFTISAKHRSKMESSKYLFETLIVIEKIENDTTITGANFVFVKTNETELINGLQNEVLILKDTGFKDIDNKQFRMVDRTPAGFYLADISGNKVDVKLVGKFDKDKTKLYIGKRENPKGIICEDGYVKFGSNIFKETVDKAELHTARFAQVKGATKYNGYNYSLKLVDGKDYRYGLYHNVEDPVGIEYVANSYSYGTYDKLLEVNGYAYFYFNKIEKKLIEHLIGQTVCYTINGNFPYSIFFELREDSFDEEGYFKLEQASAATDFGLPYRAELETTSLAGGSMFGSSEGSVGTQTEVVLIMYASLGGEFGPYAPRDKEEAKKIMEEIKYPWADVVGKERQLETSSIRVPIQNNKDVTLRQVYLRQDEPLSFNVLSIVQDVMVSDG